MVSIDIDSTIIWQFFNFLVLLWALNTVFYKPVRNILKKRAETVAELRADIGSNQQAAVDSEEAYHAKQLEIKSQGLKMWEEQKKQAQAEELAKLQEAMKKNNEFLSQQRSEMQAQLELAGAKLDHEVEQFAKDIANKILQRSLS